MIEQGQEQLGANQSFDGTLRSPERPLNELRISASQFMPFVEKLRNYDNLPVTTDINELEVDGQIVARLGRARTPEEQKALWENLR